MVALPYWSGGRTSELRAELRDTLTPLEISLERLHREVLDMANDLRGFLLTGDASLVAGVKARDAAVRRRFETAARLAARSDRSLLREIQVARRGYADWFVHSQIAMELERTGELGRRRSELSAASIGLLRSFGVTMDRIGDLVREREQALRDRLLEFQRIEQVVVLVLGTLSVVVLAYVAWLTRALLRAERVAVAERDQLEAVLASVDAGILLLDRDLRVAVANERLAELLGIPLAELVGSDWSRTAREILEPRMANPDGFEKRLAYLCENPDTVAEDFLELARPEPRTLSRYSSAVRDGTGAVVGRIEVYRDVTDVLRRERDLEEANERKDRFVATLSHELRTPLTPIFSWVDLLERERNPRRIAEGLQAIRRNAMLEAQLVEDLLDLSRVVNQKLELNWSPFDLASAVDSAVGTVRHLADAKRVRLEVRLPDQPVSVLADEVRFIQVIWNLLSNAIKFTPAGRRVVLTAAMVGERLEVVVEDEGDGISPDALEHIFRPFEQGRRGFGGGLGVGLALSRSLVELHGGEITAHSEGPGKGSRFSFWIPRRTLPSDLTGDSERPPFPAIIVEPRSAAAEVSVGVAPGNGPGPAADRVPQPPELARARGIPPGDADPAGQRVLLVEDNPDTLEAMQILLASWGCQVTATDNVPSALETLARERPDVVISDIGMPHVDGLAFAREVRERQGGERCAVLIAITGFSSAGDRQRALAAGFDAYLTKPIDFDSLRCILARKAPAFLQSLEP